MKYLLLNLYNMALCYLNYNEGGATRDCLLLLEEISASYFSIKNPLIERLLHFSTQFNVKHADFPNMKSELIHILTVTSERFGVKVRDCEGFKRTQDLRYPGLGYIPRKKVYLMDRLQAEVEERERAQNNKIESRRVTPILSNSKQKLAIKARPQPALAASSPKEPSVSDSKVRISTQMNERTDLGGVLASMSYQRGKTVINESLNDRWLSTDMSQLGSPIKTEYPSDIFDRQTASPILLRNNTSRFKFSSPRECRDTTLSHLPASVVSRTQAKLKKVLTANSVYSIKQNRSVSKEGPKGSPNKSDLDTGKFSVRHNLMRQNNSRISDSDSNTSKLQSNKSQDTSKLSNQGIKKFHIKANISNQLRLDNEMNSLVMSSRLYRTEKENMKDSER